MRTLLSACFFVVMLVIGTTCFAQPAPLDPGQLGIYSGKATLTYYSFDEAKPVKFKGTVLIAIESASSLGFNIPVTPGGADYGGSGIAKLSSTGGSVYHVSSWGGMSLGVGLKGTGDKASASLNGSIGLNSTFPHGEFAVVFTVKKLKKVPLISLRGQR